jgi:transcriptional regulator with XRE-family HTH domain
MTLGEKIRYLRIKNHLSQEALATALKTTKQAIYKYENGIVTNIPLDKIELISNILNTTPSYLMGWEEEPKQPNSVLGNFNLQLFASSEPRLSEGELALIELFRKVPEDQQSLVLSMIRAALNIKG